MTNNLPYSFVPGTKARPQEVNANFAAVMDAVNSKADKNFSDISQDALDIIKNNTSIRNLGEITCSLFPLTDSGLHLLDGALLRSGGIYDDFVSYMANLYEDGTNPPQYFCSESDWQNTVEKYNVCAKFVYDSENKTVRLPKITGLIEGTTDINALGDLVEAGLPAITHTHTRGSMNITGSGLFYSSALNNGTGAITLSNGNAHGNPGSGNLFHDVTISLNASKNWTGATSNNSAVNAIYGKSKTVQPQTVKAFYYIVVSTSTKTEIKTNLDNITTDLNGKADRDLSNSTHPAVKAPYITKTYQNGKSGYVLWSDKFCVQWGYSDKTNVTVTLPLAYKDTNYNISFGKGFNNDTNSRFPSVRTDTVTATTFKVNGGYNNTNGTDCNFYWNTKGFTK